MAKRELTEAAKAAKIIRKEMKAQGVSGRVTCSNYAGGSSLFEVLPATKDAVESFCNKFEMGHFDGMTDCYEMSNCRDDVPQVSFVFIDNDISDDTRSKVWARTCERFGWDIARDYPQGHDEHVRYADELVMFLNSRKPHVKAA